MTMETAKPAPPKASALRHAAVNLGLAAGVTLFLLLVVELGLRLSGFSYVLYPETFEFGAPDPVTLKTGFQQDDDLFWVTKDYYQRVELYQQRRPGILFMGDSLVQLGAYDLRLAERVAGRGETYRFGNLGVAGWTTYQGRHQMERDVVRIRPRVVTIHYGWNDHWIGFGIEDKNIARIKRVFASRWSGLRLVQLFTKALVAIGTRQDDNPNRVSLEDFRDNLRAMVRTAQNAGIQPVLLTAPTSIQPGEEPEYLTSRWLRELDDLLPMHAAYVDAVREVGAAEDAVVCDLESAFAELPPAKLQEIFLPDGIHVYEPGDRMIAELLDGCLQEAGLWEEVFKGST